jgi:hypothetical protein
MLLELFDAAQWHSRRTRERQGPISDDLHIEVEREDLLVTLPRAKRLGQKMTWDLARGSPVSKAPAIYPRRAGLA